MMQPLAMLKPLNWDKEDGEVEVNDSDNNSHDPKLFSVSKSNISAHPVSTMDNIMENAMDNKEQHNFEPHEEDEEEVT